MCPPWKDICISDHAKYLGLFLGPKSASHQWTKALSKFQDRISNIHSSHLPANLAVSHLTCRAIPVLGYIAQLVPPPKNTVRIGMNAVMKVLRFPGNSLSYETAFNLDMLGGPKIPSLVCYLKSCMVRTAIKTVVGFKDQHESLLIAAREHVPFGIQRRTFATPIGWDSAAFCTNLTQCLLTQGMSELVAEFRSTNHGRKSYQALAYHKLVNCLPSPTKAWILLLGDRAKMFLQESAYLWPCWHDQFSISEAGLDEIVKVLMTMREGPRLMVIKTFTNSWCTSRRLHEGGSSPTIHPCFFCGEVRKDDLAHYLECDSLWSTVISAANLGAEFLDLDPISRAGLSNPSRASYNLIACAFLVYHAIKLEHLEESLNAIATNDLSHNINLASRIAAVHLQALL